MDSNLLAAGIQHHRAGEHQQAQAIYRRLLAAHPSEAAIFNLLGAVCLDSGQLDEAQNHLAEALRLNPRLAAAHDNLGLLRARQNRLAEATASFRRAAELDPASIPTLWNLVGALTRSGQWSEAVSVLEHLVRLMPGDARALFESAVALSWAGRIHEAIAAYLATLELEPGSAAACVNLAALYIQRRQFDDAVRWSRKALELRPDFPEALQALGCALAGQEQYPAAIAALQSALRLKPELAEARVNLGVTLLDAQRFDEAVELFRGATVQRPDDPSAWYGLGNALVKSGQLAAALPHYDRAVALRPDYGEARHSRANIWLLEGRFAEGFAEYEWRLRLHDYPTAPLRWQLWNGESLAGRTLVLCGEQGLGDTIQGVRFAAILKEQGARILVECAATLHPLLARTAGIDGLIHPGADVAADFGIRMMSLPQRLQLTGTTIPAAVPYVFADAQLVARWRERLAAWDGRKVGIAWQGNPRFPGDRQRSIPLARFAPLAAVPGVRLVNLQKGPGLEQLSAVAASWPVIDFGDEIDTTSGTFMDTAAIMQGLDLVITSDTATAHLAGALGVPVWLAVQKVPDWRWLLAGEACPWYPTMRLFRQTSLGDWTDVFERLTSELADAFRS